MLLLAILFVCGTACKPTDRHRMLSFFFDGVPATGADSVMAPDSMLIAATQIVADTPLIPEAGLFASNHEPYREKDCTSCHDQNDLGRLISNEPQLCYSCHDDYATQFTALHGPVDAGFCSPCHLPHMSRHDNLLVAPGNDLCTPCHVPGGSVSPVAHRDARDRSCIDCHDPHGDAYRYIQQKPIPLER